MDACVGIIEQKKCITDSPDDGRGSSPCCSSNQTLGRRASYKTSRGL